MPSVPELLDSARNVRRAEILGQVDTEELCAADCNIAVSRKIAVYLCREKQSGYKRGKSVRAFYVVVGCVNYYSDSIGNRYFLEKAHHYKAERAHEIHRPERRFFFSIEEVARQDAR